MGAGEGAGAHEGEEVFELGEEGGDAAEEVMGQEYRQDVIQQGPYPVGHGRVGGLGGAAGGRPGGVQ